MALTREQVPGVVEEILEQRSIERQRLDLIEKYLRGNGAIPYLPRGTDKEFRELRKRAKHNILRLVVGVNTQDMYADGFRTKDGEDVAEVWDIWERNGMGARQRALFRSSNGFGYAYLLVLKGEPVPKMRYRAAKRTTAVYADPTDDEFPRYALDQLDTNLYRLYDDTFVWELSLDSDKPAGDPDRVEIEAEPFEHEMTYGGEPVCPVVRNISMLDEDDAPIGDVEPLMSHQDRINETLFNLLMAQNYGAFRQKWGIGIQKKVVKDLETGEEKEVQPFQSGVDRFWAIPQPKGDVEVGEFGQTDLDGYLEALRQAVRDAFSVSQTPPHGLYETLANLGVDALAAINQGHYAKMAEKKGYAEEALEQALRLAGEAIGVEVPEDAEIVWRDTEGRSLAQYADAAGKMAESLEIPRRGLWPKIPGVTQQELAWWDELAAQADPLEKIQNEVRSLMGIEPAGEPDEPQAA